jgi:hypothetical protein
VATNGFKVAETCRLCLCEIPYFTVIVAIIRPLEGYILSLPKVFVYCKPGVSQIRAFRFAVWFTRLGLNFKKFNSAYWGRQNSSFWQWKYFNIRMEDFFVGQTEDVRSKAGTLFGTSESGGRVTLSVLKNFDNTQNIYSSKLVYLRKKGTARCLIKFSMCTWKFWISNLLIEISRVILNLNDRRDRFHVTCSIIKCQQSVIKSLNPLVTSNKSLKNGQICFFGSTGVVNAGVEIAPRNISIEDKIWSRQVSATPRNRDER